MTLTLIIPAYNEQESLSLCLPNIIDHCEIKGYELIVINDGSLDKTRVIIEELSKNKSFVRHLSHKVNRGYGGAIKSGIKLATSDYIITIDADGQHRLEDVDKLLAIAKETNADMIVGSRAGQTVSSYKRAVGKSVIRRIAKFLMPFHIYDLNSGMKLYDTNLAKKYISLCPNSMAYSDVVVLLFVHFRCLVKEVPIKVENRVAGKSTINVTTGFETIREIVNVVLLFNPLKIFLPMSIVILIASLIWGIPIILAGRGVSIGTLLGILLSIFLLFLGLIAEQISIIQKRSID